MQRSIFMNIFTIESKRIMVYIFIKKCIETSFHIMVYIFSFLPKVPEVNGSGQAGLSFGSYYGPQQSHGEVLPFHDIKKCTAISVENDQNNKGSRGPLCQVHCPTASKAWPLYHAAGPQPEKRG